MEYAHLGRTGLKISRPALGAMNFVEAIRMAEVDNFSGTVVIDATNTLDMSGGDPPRLVDGLGNEGHNWMPRELVK